MLEGKRIALLVEDDFEDSELVEPMNAMKEAGFEVTLVGSGSKTSYRGKRRRATVKVDTTADMVKANDFDAIIVPGGYAPDKMRMHQPMIDLVKDAYARGKIIAGICHGPQLLISAGIVKGKTMTSWPSVAIDLQNAGARWVDEPLVRDGAVITARKPADIPQFNAAIIKALSE